MAAESAAAGRIICRRNPTGSSDGGTHPVNGNTLRFRPKTMMAIMPSTKSGMATANAQMTPTTRSKIPPAWLPAYSATGMLTSNARTTRTEHERQRYEPGAADLSHTGRRV